MGYILGSQVVRRRCYSLDAILTRKTISLITSDRSMSDSYKYLFRPHISNTTRARITPLSNRKRASFNVAL